MLCLRADTFLIFCGVILFALINPAFDQIGNLRGDIPDKLSGQKLDGALQSMSSKACVVLTNGRYRASR